jgi:hypothetical protein
VAALFWRLRSAQAAAVNTVNTRNTFFLHKELVPSGVAVVARCLSFEQILPKSRDL